VDFGIGHDFAAVWLTWDRDRDVVYVYDVYSKPGEKISEHVSQLNRRGHWIPVIWPHDGLQPREVWFTPSGGVPEGGREYVAREVFKPSDSWAVEEGRGR
jgi:hypothetical protein